MVERGQVQVILPMMVQGWETPVLAMVATWRWVLQLEMQQETQQAQVPVQVVV